MFSSLFITFLFQAKLSGAVRDRQTKTEIETERQTDRQTDRDRQTETETV